MNKYTIKVITDLSKLSSRTEEVSPTTPKKEVLHIIKQIEDTLKLHPTWNALSAPQLGINLRIFCIQFADKKIKSFINPMITKHSEDNYFSLNETCASIPDKSFICLRSKSLNAIYQNREGKIEENKFEGAAAVYFEQMCQLLDGLTIADWGLEKLEGFDDAPEADKKEILGMYAGWLKSYMNKVQKDIDSNKDLKDSQRAIEFLTSVATGKTEVVPENESGDLDFANSSLVGLKKQAEEDKNKAEWINTKLKEIVKKDKELEGK